MTYDWRFGATSICKGWQPDQLPVCGGDTTATCRRFAKKMGRHCICSVARFRLAMRVRGRLVSCKRPMTGRRLLLPGLPLSRLSLPASGLLDQSE